jgi:hypothetical protein
MTCGGVSICLNGSRHKMVTKLRDRRITSKLSHQQEKIAYEDSHTKGMCSVSVHQQLNLEDFCPFRASCAILKFSIFRSICIDTMVLSMERILRSGSGSPCRRAQSAHAASPLWNGSSDFRKGRRKGTASSISSGRA